MISRYIENLKSMLYSSPVIEQVEIMVEEITLATGVFRAKTTLVNSSELHIFEYIALEG